MNLELHHFFILVEPEAKVAKLLLSLGMQEGTRNKHEGQGTSNRRFNFSNGTLELLWVHDAEEAIRGPGRDMFFPERAEDPTASPFGVILNRKDNASLKMPFEGWKYEPVYFAPPWAFHVGANSSNLLEPLCIYVPFIEPEPSACKVKEGTFKSISKVHIYTPSEPVSDVLGVADTADRLAIDHGKRHLMEITFDNQMSGFTRDLRPHIPLILHW
ncbi:MAG: VOC family protein [Gammaproteobacteria bacterium]|nr:VOC family protein [Gammaproteobacteria bacterium]